jgi:hypothetical protein
MAGHKLSKLEAGYRHPVIVAIPIQLPDNCLERLPHYIIENTENICSQCSYFRNGDCLLVDKDSEGDDAGTIHPNATCRFFNSEDVKLDFRFYGYII